MITIIKKKIKISKELLSKIEWACAFSKTTPKIINGTLRIIKHTNLAYIEPCIWRAKAISKYISNNKFFLPSQNSDYGTSPNPFVNIFEMYLTSEKNHDILSKD